MYDTSCARFASGMSVALKSGLDTEEGFDLVTQLVDVPIFARRLLLPGKPFRMERIFPTL